MGWEFKPYVSVATRRAKAERQMNVLRKQKFDVQPISISGRKIARSFWGESWCRHLESFSDYSNRLPRGRTYVRNGSVCHLAIDRGEVKAIVSGSSLYDVKIEIKKLREDKWLALKKRCSGQIGSLLELLQGMLSDSVMLVVTDKHQGLFPTPSEILLNCSCPDWAVMCKHVAAVLYGVGSRLDEKPELLFLLRGVDHEELIETDVDSFAAITSGSSSSKRGGSRRIADQDLGDLFGIEMRNEQPTTRGRKSVKTTSVEPVTLIAKSAKSESNSKSSKSSLKLNSRAEVELTGKKISELRTKFQMSQSQLALLIGVSATSIGVWENKKGRLNLQKQNLRNVKDSMRLTKREAWSKIEGEL